MSLDFNDNKRELELFGEDYIGPDILPHLDWVLAARYVAENEDGVDVEVYVSACPARFYKVELPNGVAFQTGTGMGEVAVQMAKGFAAGMLRLDLERI